MKYELFRNYGMSGNKHQRDFDTLSELLETLENAEVSVLTVEEYVENIKENIAMDFNTEEEREERLNEIIGEIQTSLDFQNLRPEMQIVEVYRPDCTFSSCIELYNGENSVIDTIEKYTDYVISIDDEA